MELKLMATNTSEMETGTNQPLSTYDAVDKLAGLLADSQTATPDEPESENQEAEGVEDDSLESEAESDAQDAEDEAEQYEAEDDSAEEIEEPEVESNDYVMINDEKVSLDEIGKSYMRQADYTRKAQEVAAARKELEATKAQIAQEREHLKQALEVFQAQQAQGEPDWAAMAEEDPLGYITAKARYDADMQTRQAAMAERQRIEAIQQQEAEARQREYLAKAKEQLVESIPELKSEKATEYRANIATYMEGLGYSKEELGQLYDPRAVILADKARKYDALMSKQGKVAQKAKGAPKITKPGKSVSKQSVATKQRQQARSRLKQSGSVDDAVAALLG